MRPRTEVLLAVAVLASAVSLTTWLSRRNAAISATTGYATTFVSDPPGARAFFDATQALGIGARRFRQRTTVLPGLLDSTRRQLVAVLEPQPFSPAESEALLQASLRTDLLLAGPGASKLMACFGYEVGDVRPGPVVRPSGSPSVFDLARRDSVQAVLPGDEATAASPWVRWRLERHFERLNVDSSRRTDAGIFSCTVPPLGRIDTLLTTTSHQPVALRIQRLDGGAHILLVADEDLFRNASLRRTAAGEFALGLITGRYDQVIFDEYHHGYHESGSMRDAALAWSLRSPWGWAVWQLAAVGMVALLFGMVRFGPVRPAIARTRRSSLEHVRALATALSAARGADVAIAAIIRGLRRRLAPGARGRTDWREWLAGLAQHAGSARTRALVGELQSLSLPGQPPESVRRAAITVEELWQELRP